MPAIHAGMTKSAFFILSGERKLMKRSFETFFNQVRDRCRRDWPFRLSGASLRFSSKGYTFFLSDTIAQLKRDQVLNNIKRMVWTIKELRIPGRAKYRRSNFVERL